MPWIPPTYSSAITWQDLPSHATPLNANDLNLEDTGDAAYSVMVTNSAVTYLETGGSTKVVALGGVVGSAGQQVIVRSDGTIGMVDPVAVSARAWGVNANASSSTNAANLQTAITQAATNSAQGTGSSGPSGQVNLGGNVITVNQAILMKYGVRLVGIGGRGQTVLKADGTAPLSSFTNGSRSNFPAILKWDGGDAWAHGVHVRGIQFDTSAIAGLSATWFEAPGENFLMDDLQCNGTVPVSRVVTDAQLTSGSATVTFTSSTVTENDTNAIVTATSGLAAATKIDRPGWANNYAFPPTQNAPSVVLNNAATANVANASVTIKRPTDAFVFDLSLGAAATGRIGTLNGSANSGALLRIMSMAGGTWDIDEIAGDSNGGGLLRITRGSNANFINSNGFDPASIIVHHIKAENGYDNTVGGTTATQMDPVILLDRCGPIKLDILGGTAATSGSRDIVRIDYPLDLTQSAGGGGPSIALGLEAQNWFNTAYTNILRNSATGEVSAASAATGAHSYPLTLYGRDIRLLGGGQLVGAPIPKLAKFVDPPSGVVGGSTDTTNIHATRDAAGANGTVVFLPGTYWVTGLTANVTGQQWLIPRGCTIKLANSTNAPVLTVSAASVMVKGLGIIDGNAANNTGSSNLGVWVTAASNTVRYVTVQNTYQAGIYFQASNTTIQGNTVLNTVLGPGIYCQPGTLADVLESRVLDNIVDKSSQNPSTAQGYGIQLHGGLGAATFTATSTLNGLTLTSVSSFTGIANGAMLTGTNLPVGTTVQSFNSGAGTITMTLPATGAGTGSTITLNYGLRGVVVSRNEVKLPVSAVNTMLGIEVWGYTPGAMITQNRTYGGNMGISLDRSDNGTVTANNVEAYSANGVEVANSTGVAVGSNACDAATIGGDGIIFDGLVTPSTKCEATGNTIVRATSKAIFVITNGDHMAITGNAITCAYGLNCTGVYVQNSPSTTVTGNMLYCASLVANDAIAFEGNSSSGAVVQANVIEGWPRSAVTLFVGSNQGSTSSLLSTASPITSIPVSALPGVIAAGTVWIGSPVNSQSQSFTTAGAAGGATAIPVTSQTPNFAYPSSSIITTVNPMVDRVVLGPNVLNGNGATLTAVSSAVIGPRCRFVYAEQGLASPNTSAITVTASPFTYTNNDHNPEMVYITGGTVSAVAKNAINIFTASPCAVYLEPGEAIIVTYTVAPTMNKDVG